MRIFGHICWAVMALCFALGGARAQNLVQDPSFEASTNFDTNPFWTIGTGNEADFENICSTCGTDFRDNGVLFEAHSGNWFVSFPATSQQAADNSIVSQVIQTVPGTTYLVTFFLANNDTDPNTFLAKFGGQTVLSLTNVQPFTYQQFSATITATTNSSTLAFDGEQVPGEFLLDDVSVQESAPAPTVGGGIASFVLLAIGVAFHRLRRRPAFR